MPFEWDPNEVNDDLRSVYRREDFGPMVRGKHAARLKEPRTLSCWTLRSLRHFRIPKQSTMRRVVCLN
jgi:hypothetical protein